MIVYSVNKAIIVLCHCHCYSMCKQYAHDKQKVFFFFGGGIDISVRLLHIFEGPVPSSFRDRRPYQGYLHQTADERFGDHPQGKTWNHLW